MRQGVDRACGDQPSQTGMRGKRTSAREIPQRLLRRRTRSLSRSLARFIAKPLHRPAAEPHPEVVRRRYLTSLLASRSAKF